MKKAIYFLILVTVFLSFATIVLATDLGWNGGAEGNVPGATGGACDPKWKGFCNYNNANHKTIKVSFAYINNGSVTYHGSPIYITNNRSAVTVVSSQFDTNRLISYTDMNIGSVTLSSNLHGGGAASMLESYFTNLANFKHTLSKMGLNYDSFDFKDSQKAPVANGYGYRLIVEPVQTGYEGNIAKLMTLKETADSGRTNKSFWSDSSVKAQLWLYLQYDDVGFKKADTSNLPISTATSTPYRVPAVAELTSGYGIALVDPSDLLIIDKCKDKKSKLVKGSTEYKKLINDTAWEVNNNPNATKDILECFTCEEYIEEWGESNSIVQTLKAGGKISWTLPKCSRVNTCAEFKTKNPNPTYSQMLDANVEWPGCYTCDNNSVFKANTPSCNGGGSCSYSLDVSIPNKCTVKKDGHVKDISNWKCIFDSTKSSNSVIRAHYVQTEMSSNRFCDVYCREEVTYKYPDDKLTVYAGRRFTIENSAYLPTLTPVKFKSTTQCRTTSASKQGEIDLDKFKTTWDNADKAVNTAWDAYQNEIALSYAIANSTSTGSYSGTCYCSDGKGGSKPCGSYSYTNYSGKGVNGVYTKSVSYCIGSKCSGSCSKPTSNVAGKKASYDSAKKTREQVLVELHQCNNFQYTNRKFSPSVNFKYEEAIYGNKTYALDKTLKIDSNTKYFNSGTAIGSATGSVGTANWSTGSYEKSSSEIIKGDNTIRGDGSGRVNRYDCDKQGAKCIYNYNIQAHEKNKWVEQTTNKEYTYTLPKGVYEYISKPSGLSVDTEAEALKYSKQYYKLGYSNLPVHYSRKEGKYDYEFDYDSFGNKSLSLDHKFNKHIIKNQPFGTTTFTGKTKYECTYNVKQKIIIEKGLNLIYRPISLSNPFPGENGTGRNPGENWSPSGVVDKNITNNRGEKEYNIYINKSPMYKITLTPTLIKEIRSYNKSQKAKKETYYDYNGGKGKVTGVAGYSDFELDCDNNGVTCKSRFIRSTVNGYNFSKYFTGCGIKGKDSGLKCVSGEGW